MNKYYISFADTDGFLGACVIEAESIYMALIVATIQGCNPGGEAKIVRMPDYVYSADPYPLNTLLSRADIKDGVKWVD